MCSTHAIRAVSPNSHYRDKVGNGVSQLNLN